MQVDRNGRPVLVDATGRIPRPDILDYAMGRATGDQVRAAHARTLAEAREQAWAAVNAYERARTAGHLAGAYESRNTDAMSMADAAESLVTALHAMLRATA